MSPVARRYRIVVFSVCLLLACSAAAYGQDTVRVPGVIVQEGGGPQGGLIAELCDPLGDKVVSRAVVVPAGEFAFEAVTPGQYRLRIAAWGGEILAQRVVSAGSDGTPVEIRLASSTSTSTRRSNGLGDAFEWAGGPAASSTRVPNAEQPGQRPNQRPEEVPHSVHAN